MGAKELIFISRNRMPAKSCKSHTVWTYVDFYYRHVGSKALAIIACLRSITTDILIDITQVVVICLFISIYDIPTNYRHCYRHVGTTDIPTYNPLYRGVIVSCVVQSVTVVTNTLKGAYQYGMGEHGNTRHNLPSQIMPIGSFHGVKTIR